MFLSRCKPMCNVKMEALKVFLDRWSQNNNNFFSLFKKTVQNNKTRLCDLKYLYDYALVAMPFRPDGLSFLGHETIQVSGAYMCFLKLHVFWLLARNNPRFTFRFCLLNSSDVSKACIKYVMDGEELIPLMYSKCRSVDAGTKKLFSEWYRLKKVLVRNSEILGTDRNVWKAPEIIDNLSFSGNSIRRT